MLFRSVLNDDLITDYNLLNKLTNNYFISKDYSFNTNYSKKISLFFEQKKEEQIIQINGTEVIVPALKEYQNFFVEDLNHFYFEYEINNIDEFNIFFCIFSLIYLMVIYYFLINYKNIKKILFFSAIICFEFSSVMSFNFINKILLTTLILLCSFIVKDKIILKKNDILIFLASVISTFCLSGTFILDNLNKSIILFEVALYCINFIILYFTFNKIKEISFNSNTLYKKKHKFILFFIIFLILIIYKFIIGDCFVHPDGYMQLGQINGTREISNWHPLMHTLYIKYLNIIFNGISGFVYFRILVVSLIATSVLSYFYKKGLNLKIVYIIGILFAFFPVNIIYITYLFGKLVLEKKLSIINWICLFLCLASILYFRHNGILTFIGLSILLIVYFIYHRKLWSILLTIVSCTFIVGTSYFVNNSFKDMRKYDNFILAPLAHGLDYLYVNDLLPNNDKEFLNNITSENTWLNGYNKYNIDILIHYGQFSFVTADFDHSKFINIYVNNFVKYPIYMIKDRLYGTDIMWNVFGSDNKLVYRYHLIYDEYRNDWVKNYGIKRNNNVITEYIHTVLLYLGSNDIFDFIFFRGGIYFIIINTLICYCLWIKRYNLLLMFVPCLLNNLSLFLAMHHQSYRYILYMPFVAMICLFSVLYYKKTS